MLHTLGHSAAIFCVMNTKTVTALMHSQPPKSPNSPDKGTPPDKGAGGLGDLLPCLSPQPPCQGGQETALLAIPPYHGGVQRGSGGLWKLR